MTDTITISYNYNVKRKGTIQKKAAGKLILKHICVDLLIVIAEKCLIYKCSFKGDRRTSCPLLFYLLVYVILFSKLYRIFFLIYKITECIFLVQSALLGWFWALPAAELISLEARKWWG